MLKKLLIITAVLVAALVVGVLAPAAAPAVITQPAYAEAPDNGGPPPDPVCWWECVAGDCYYVCWG